MREQIIQWVSTQQKSIDEAIATAKAFKPLSEQEVAGILTRTQKAAAEGEFEGYKMTTDFDGTHKNPKWLGDVPEALA